MIDLGGKWCILRTGGQRTIALMRSLTAAGIDAWTPIESRKRRRARSKAVIEIEAAMMPTFVFARADRAADLARVRVDPASPHPAFSLFHYQGRVPLISNAEVERLRTLERKQAPKERRKVFAAGAGVRVPEGPFGGMSGVVKQGDDRYTLVAFAGHFEVKIATFLLIDDAVQTVKPTQGAPAGSAMVS